MTYLAHKDVEVIGMITPNLGKVERVIRFLLAILLTAWLLSREQFGWLEIIGSIAALFLLLNALLARCYAWSWLGINSCKDDQDCRQRPC